MKISNEAESSGNDSVSGDLCFAAAVLRKDRKATAEFVARYADPLYGYLHSRLAPRDDFVDDVLQEVFKPEGKVTEKAIVSVRGGQSVDVTMIRDLGHVVDREKARIGVFITLAEPTGPMKTEAVKAGFYETLYGKYPKLQILTIADLFAGKQPNIPLGGLGFVQESSAGERRRPGQIAVLIVNALFRHYACLPLDRHGSVNNRYALSGMGLALEEVSIRAEQLTKRYRSGQAELVIFAGLSFQVPIGERLALIGESGAGKSTLLHLLGGLDRPSTGKVFFGSSDLFALSDSDLARLRNREIGFVWQQNSLLPEFTALENVMMPLLVRGIAGPEASEPAMARLGEVGLKNRASHRAGELSGGEQQRVALARALVSSPRILLADEPTGNLDYRTGEMVMDLLSELHQTHRLTSVYVTHNLEFARRCDRILRLEKGELTPVGSASAGDGAPGKEDRKPDV